MGAYPGHYDIDGIPYMYVYVYCVYECACVWINHIIEFVILNDLRF